MANDEVMTAHDVADLLKVKVDFIYQLKAQHKIPFHKINGKLLRFYRSEIDEWLQAQ